MIELDLVRRFEDELSEEIRRSYPFIYVIVINNKGIKIFDVVKETLVEINRNSRLFLDKLEKKEIKTFKDLLEELKNTENY